MSTLKLNLESKHGSTNYKNVQSMVTTTAPLSLPNKRHSNRKNLSGRLSMYSMDVKISKGKQRRRIDIRRKSIRKLFKVLYYLLHITLNILYI